MTLEEAQAQILQLQEEKVQLTNERDTLSQNNAELAKELDDVRKLNQQYFNKLSQQFIPAEDKKKDDDIEVPSCEDFARSLQIF